MLKGNRLGETDTYIDKEIDMGDGADDAREREEDMKLQRALHGLDRCDGAEGGCPICMREWYEYDLKQSKKKNNKPRPRID